MDSNEQLPQGDSATTVVTEQPTKVEINWEQVDLEELKKGYLRQSDYTKKTQELAKQREELEKGKLPVSNDEAEVDNYLKSKGYLTKADIDREKLWIKQELAMDKFFSNNPELSQFETAIREIAKTDNSALEDIVVKYNFSTTDKLQKAKSSRPLVGDSKKTESAPKNRVDLTKEEKAKWKQENWLSWRRWSFSD